MQRAAIILLSLSACTPTVPVDLTIVLPTNDPAFTQQIQSFTLSAYSLDDKRVLATASVETSKLGSLQPRLRLKVGDEVRVRIRALDAQQNVIGAGESRLTIPAQQQSTITAFVGPIDGFVVHPQSTTLARSDASTVQDASGRVWSFGGRVDGAPSGLIEVYDPSTLSFTRLDVSLNTAVISPSVGRVAPDGHELLVIAGGIAAGNVVSDAVQVLDPATRTLGSAQRLATGARAHAAVYAPGDQRLLLLGGEGPRGDEGATGATLFVNSLVVSDTRVSSTQPPIALTPARNGAQVVQLGEAWFLVGGTTNASISSFDPLTGQTALVATSNFDRASVVCVAATANTVYFACGGSGTLERFIVGQQAIEIIAQEANATRSGALLFALPDGRLLLNGGLVSDAPTKTNLVFTLSPLGLKTDLAFTTPRLGHQLVFTTTRTLLALGGGSPVAELLSFDGP